jgi:hypothetical protein
VQKVRDEQLCFEALIREWPDGPDEMVKVALLSALINRDKIEEVSDSIYEISETLKEILAQLKRR